MAASAQGIEADEQVVLRARLHPVVLAGGLIAAAFVAFVATLLIRHNDLPAGTDARIVFWAVLIAAMFLLRPVLRWQRSVVFVTDRRLVVRVGALRLETASQPLAADGVSAGVTSWLGRLLDYGTLAVATGRGDAWTVWPVAQPMAVVDAVQAAVKKLKRRT